jgi:hypothetical protein
MKSMLEQVNEAYAQGMSDAEVMEILGMSRKQFERRLETDPVFREWIEMGRTLSEAWWMRKGRTSIHDSKFNTNLWMFVVKNRFDWAEKVEQRNNGTSGTTSLDQIKREMANLVSKLKSGKATDAEIVELANYRTGTDGSE